MAPSSHVKVGFRPKCIEVGQPGAPMEITAKRSRSGNLYGLRTIVTPTPSLHLLLRSVSFEELIPPGPTYV
jgi:hypothetical protein